MLVNAADHCENGNRAVTIFFVDVFDALADPVRRRILRILVAGPRRVVDLRRELSDDTSLSRPAVSRHLRVLGAAGLVSATEAGRERHYRLERAALDEVRRYLDALGGISPTVAPSPPIRESMLDALETEVHRARRERRRITPAPTIADHATSGADSEETA